MVKRDCIFDILLIFAVPTTTRTRKREKEREFFNFLRINYVSGLTFINANR